MGKLLNSLNKQLKSEHKSDAEDCLKIYNYLKETNDGRVWESQWNNLVSTDFEGTYPNSIRISKPNQIGRIFLKGLLKNLEL
jgi:hypothetical protein